MFDRTEGSAHTWSLLPNIATEVVLAPRTRATLELFKLTGHELKAFRRTFDRG